MQNSSQKLTIKDCFVYYKKKFILVLSTIDNAHGTLLTFTNYTMVQISCQKFSGIYQKYFPKNLGSFVKFLRNFRGNPSQEPVFLELINSGKFLIFVT